jgi:hypothetical protein
LLRGTQSLFVYTKNVKQLSLLIQLTAEQVSCGLFQVLVQEAFTYRVSDLGYFRDYTHVDKQQEAQPWRSERHMGKPDLYPTTLPATVLMPWSRVCRLSPEHSCGGRHTGADVRVGPARPHQYTTREGRLPAGSQSTRA